MRYEYKRSEGEHLSADFIESQDKDGWELVTMFSYTVTTIPHPTKREIAIFRKPKS